MAELFNVVFAGELVGRADAAAVRANVGKLFGASEAVLDKLFSGQPVAIKKGVDRATAMQLRARMKQAGAETRLVQVDAQGQPVAGAASVPPAASAAAAAMPRPTSPAAAPGAQASAVAPAAPAVPAPAAQASSAPAPAAPAPGSMAARLAALAGEPAAAPPARAVAPAAPAAPAAPVASGNWDVKPVGSRLSDPVPPPPPAPDVSAISLAPARGNLVAPEELAHAAPVQVDISRLSMAAPNTEILRDDERPRVTPVQVDLSGMSLAEVGAPLDEIREHKPLLNPDTSYLKLVD